MSKLVLKNKEFNELMDELISVDIETRKSINLISFEEKTKLFKFDKNIKANEMNDYSRCLLNNISNLNTRINNSYSQIIKIYKLLEILNKEYVNGIVEAINDASEARKDINVTIDKLKETVKKLYDFKNDIYSKLSFFEVDKINCAINNYKEEVEKANQNILNLFKSFDEVFNKYKEQVDNKALQIYAYLDETIKKNNENLERISNSASDIYSSIKKINENHEILFSKLENYKKENYRLKKAYIINCCVTCFFALVSISAIILCFLL